MCRLDDFEKANNFSQPSAAEDALGRSKSPSVVSEACSAHCVVCGNTQDN